MINRLATLEDLGLSERERDVMFCEQFLDVISSTKVKIWCTNTQLLFSTRRHTTQASNHTLSNQPSNMDFNSDGTSSTTEDSFAFPEGFVARATSWFSFLIFVFTISSKKAILTTVETGSRLFILTFIDPSKSADAVGDEIAARYSAIFTENMLSLPDYLRPPVGTEFGTVTSEEVTLETVRARGLQWEVVSATVCVCAIVCVIWLMYR